MTMTTIAQLVRNTPAQPLAVSYLFAACHVAIRSGHDWSSVHIALMPDLRLIASTSLGPNMREGFEWSFPF